MTSDQDSISEQMDGDPAHRRTSHSRTISKLVEGKNINPETLLATDYLNHFNEIVMLLDMVPMMPECLDDAKAWAPKSYEEHFRDSAFTDKDLAILAYENAPERFRVPFDRTIGEMNTLVAEGLVDIEQAVASGNQDRIELAVGEVSRSLQGHIDKASAIIHGNTGTMDQSAVDAILNS